MEHRIANSTKRESAFRHKNWKILLSCFYVNVVKLVLTWSKRVFCSYEFKKVDILCSYLWVLFWAQLVFEDYVERAKEKEEKEAKKRRRMADDFTNLLRSTKVFAHF